MFSISSLGSTATCLTHPGLGHHFIVGFGFSHNDWIRDTLLSVVSLCLLVCVQLARVVPGASNAWISRSSTSLTAQLRGIYGILCHHLFVLGDEPFRPV